jgi:hypothetical protein
VIVSHSPKVVAGTPVNFSSKELKSIFDWVVENEKLLYQLAREEITIVDFASKLN